MSEILNNFWLRVSELWYPTVREPSINAAPAPDSAATVMVKQLRFLLSQAPMQQAPVDAFTAGRAVTPFAYIHPKTFSRFYFTPIDLLGSNHTYPGYCRVGPSRTKWVVTTMMPEGTVIYTPNPLPGIENILAR